MQRCTNASSTSEISSKSWLAMASLVRGLNLSGGMPAGLIYHQEDAFVLSSSYLPGKLLESHREQLFVDGGQDQPVDLSGCGSYKAIKVGPLVSPLEPGCGPLTYRCPYPTHHRL